MGVRGGVGAVGEAVRLLGLIPEVVEDRPRLDARDAPLGVDLEHAVQVLGEVDDDGDVRGLAGEARAAAAREHRHVMRPADLDGRDDVVDRARDDDPDRHLPVVGASGRVERARAGAEPDLAGDDGGELARQAA